MILFLIISIIISAFTCRKVSEICQGESHTGITVFNQSSRKLNFNIYSNHPDTLIGKFNPKGYKVVKPGRSRTMGAGATIRWKEALNGDKKE